LLQLIHLAVSESIIRLPHYAGFYAG
jgi:hypothetical protein